MKKANKLKKNPERLGFLQESNTRSTAGTYKDLKRQAIALGMPFPEATACSIFDFIGYIEKSSLDKVPNVSLIDQYDDWVDAQLAASGLPEDDPLRSSKLRLGFLGDPETKEDPENGEVKRKTRRLKGLKKTKKAPREKDEHGHVKGTKKAFTWYCVEKGLSLERTIRRVTKKFPEAKLVSIRLWYKKATKELKK